MTPEKPTRQLTASERLNFLLTNRLPRRWLTLAMGRFSKIRHPLLARLSIRVWQMFVDDLRLHEARKTSFDSLHDCFIRELKPDARTINAESSTLISPCDAVVGAFGALNELVAIQAKGFPYQIDELLGDPRAAERYRNGSFLTLRLKSSMYHRFHAPLDANVGSVTYLSGDTWNVNPVALKVIERLFCRNERVAMELHPNDSDAPITLVAVAAILVASVRLHGLREPLNLEYAGPNRIELSRQFRKGDEIGYFEHGSTIVLLTPGDFRFEAGLASGNTVRMGQPLMRLPSHARNQ